ncbi:MAG: alpha/beta hydrolase [Bacillota bacterium]|nr:alpha/beta hydrolase [Bacillota bacterium]
MLYETIDLNSIFPEMPKGDVPVTITAYCMENSHEMDLERKYPAIVVFPGGGYRFTSDREAEPVAHHFLARGFQVFVVRYSIAPTHYPAQLIQAAAAVAYVRRNAEKYLIDPCKIAVMGFSAGGHLACMIGTLFGEKVISDTIGVSVPDCRPDAMVLSYPVITFGIKTHGGSMKNMTGGSSDKNLIYKLSLENSVTDNTPPAFIWHTFTDKTVPVENSLYIAEALRKHNIPFELHIFENGPHGLALATKETTKPSRPDFVNKIASQWTNLCTDWLNKQFE